MGRVELIAKSWLMNYASNVILVLKSQKVKILMDIKDK